MTCASLHLLLCVRIIPFICSLDMTGNVIYQSISMTNFRHILRYSSISLYKFKVLTSAMIDHNDDEEVCTSFTVLTQDNCNNWIVDASAPSNKPLVKTGHSPILCCRKKMSKHNLMILLTLLGKDQGFVKVNSVLETYASLMQ